MDKDNQVQDQQPEDNLSHTEDKYIRVGTDYYLQGVQITSKKQTVPCLLFWKKSVILEDHGRPAFSKIKKYISFANIPDNKATYQREFEVHGNLFYNLYEQLKHKPKEGAIDNTHKFLKHVFQNMLPVIEDYLKILYENPTQKLPVICLVSKDQETGKTTFLQWLCEIFGNNAIRLGNEDFSSKFNAHWTGKLIVGIDESFIDKILIKEKIKRLATDDRINMEAKGRDIIKLDFNGKFILLSNKEDNFIQMEKEDNRFFVVKVPTLKPEEKDPDLLEKLKEEIPAYLSYLEKRDLIHPKRSRLWFEPKDYETEAMRKIIVNTRTKVEKEMLRWFDDLFGREDVGEEINIVPIKLAEQLKETLRQINALPIDIERIFKEEWKLSPAVDKPQKFKYPTVASQYDESEHMMVDTLSFIQWTGKFYSIKKEFIAQRQGK